MARFLRAPTCRLGRNDDKAEIAAKIKDFLAMTFKKDCVFGRNDDKAEIATKIKDFLAMTLRGCAGLVEMMIRPGLVRL